MKLLKKRNRRTDKPKAICPSIFFKVGGIKILVYCMVLFFPIDFCCGNFFLTASFPDHCLLLPVFAKS